MIKIESGIDSSLGEDEPIQPSAIVLLIPPKMGDSFPKCFTTKIGEMVNKAFDPTRPPPLKKLDLHYFQSAEDVTAIHNDLKAYFNGNGKVVVVRDVEKLSRHEHLFVFHYFCDNFLAYDKRATFLFLLPVPPEILHEFEWREINGYDIADRVLGKAWDNLLTEDVKPAMISRIAASVVLLNEGDRC
jgi:hypothetical protein